MHVDVEQRERIVERAAADSGRNFHPLDLLVHLERTNRRELQFDDFSGAVDFVNRLTPIANELDHHPDIFLSFGLVRVSLISHSEHGITEKEFELAKRLDELA